MKFRMCKKTAETRDMSAMNFKVQALLHSHLEQNPSMFYEHKVMSFHNRERVDYVNACIEC